MFLIHTYQESVIIPSSDLKCCLKFRKLIRRELRSRLWGREQDRIFHFQMSRTPNYPEFISLRRNLMILYKFVSIICV